MKTRKQFHTPYALHLAGSALMTGLLLYAVFRELSVESFFGLVAGVQIKGLTIYAALSLAALALRALRYQLIVRQACARENNKLNFGSVLVVSAVRNALVDFLPARLGEVGFLYLMRRQGVPLLVGISTFAVCTVLDIVVLFGLLAILASLDPIRAAGSAGTALLLNVPLALTIFALLAAFLLQLHWILAFAGRLAFRTAPRASRASAKAGGAAACAAQKLYTLSREIERLRTARTYAALVVITVLLRAAKYASLTVLLSAVVAGYGITLFEINFFLATVAFVAAEASASLPISGLMGFGAYEGSWSIVFSLTGAAIPNTTAVILAVHLFTQMLSYALGFAGLAVFTWWEATDRSKEKAAISA